MKKSLLDSKIDSKNTIVIADFDGTFTKKEVMGNKTSALMTILMDEKYLGKAGLQASHELFNHYYPIELDPHINEIDKNALMQEWWEKSFAVIRECKVSKEMLLEVCRSPLLQWRDQLLDFVKILNAKKIPLIIYSAGGFGKLAIEYLLEKENIFADNIKVFSNEIIFDEQGYFLEIVQPIVHIANKTGHLLIKNNLLTAVPDRRHCLLIGDSLDDKKMTTGIDFDSVYKVAFSSHNLEHFAKDFDLVLPVDGSFEKIIDLLN
jgi:5'-nucleotidase